MSICTIVCSAFSFIILVDAGSIAKPASTKLISGDPLTCPAVGFLTPVLTILSKASSAPADIALYAYLTGAPPTNLTPFQILLSTGPAAALMLAVNAISPARSKPVLLSSVSPKKSKTPM